MRIHPWAAGLALALVTAAVPALAQQSGGALTEEDYRRAEQFLGMHANDLVYRASVSPRWIADDAFWYRNRIREGHEFVRVDAGAGTRERAFDHARLAGALGAAMDTTVQPFALPFQSFDYEDGRTAIRFTARNREWRCDIRSYRCEATGPAGRGVPNSITSPDGGLAAFIRDHDLWVRDLESGRDIRLTHDGEEHYGYATDSQGWRSTPNPVILWSPDSRSIVTYQLDEREVGDIYLWATGEPRPELRSWKYALPGDSIVPLHERVVIHLNGPRVVRLNTPPHHQRKSSCCGLTVGQDYGDVQWRSASRTLAFVSTSRDYRDVTLKIADANTGQVRTVYEERGEPFFESSGAGRGRPSWHVLEGTDDFIWYSRRDGWGHLYLYDLNTGTLKNRITSGEWAVLELLRVDEANRWAYFTAAGREPGRDPNLFHFYRARLDGSAIELLTPEDAHHDLNLSPDGSYFVNTYSLMDQPPVTVLRRADGSVVTRLEEADISDLRALGWPFPIPFTVKARDGETDLYGVMFRPSNFDPSRRYPIINSNYPGPQAGSIGSRSFSAARRNAQALAELGFIVVQIDAFGTPWRSHEFQAYYYGDMGDNGLPDQIAGMRQLAERHPWIDLDRVGIFGHSGGGFAAAAAILRHPDFFHVAVSSAGNHDNRGYTYYWGEKWHGPLIRDEDGSDNYEASANHSYAQNLRGRLLISYGTLDSNVHPNTTLLLIDELIRHNKDFDLIVFPNRGHGYSGEPYNLRRTWDYFVRHLAGKEPPHEYEIRRDRPEWRPVSN